MMDYTIILQDIYDVWIMFYVLMDQLSLAKKEVEARSEKCLLYFTLTEISLDH